ncbi:MAG: hypothetical protein L0228_01805 [Planctomycetes bacterium]|nr:hypothetical protein [Planctomycetota bacterium]
MEARRRQAGHFAGPQPRVHYQQVHQRSILAAQVAKRRLAARGLDQQPQLLVGEVAPLPPAVGLGVERLQVGERADRQPLLADQPLGKALYGRQVIVAGLDRHRAFGPLARQPVANRSTFEFSQLADAAPLKERLDAID